MKEKGFLKRIIDFIGKDTSIQNESKKLIVVIRLLLLSISVYCILSGIFCSVGLNWGKTVLFLIFLAACIGILAMTYYYETAIVLWAFNIAVICWMILTVHLLGWNVGVQHFLIMLLVLYFFSSYKNYGKKILFSFFLVILRIVLFFIYQNRVPEWQLTVFEEDVSQIINTVIIFWCISIIVFVFSNDAQELEGKLIEYNNQLKKQANTDTLTGLYNRRKALEYMEYICAKEVQNQGFSLCIGDIDYFKKVNDNYGHDTGDEVLKKIAEIFQNKTKEKDFAARWGGEEFLLVFPGCNGDEAYLKVADIAKEIKKLRIKKDDTEFGVTVTFGLTEYNFQRGLNETIKEADEKLYIGKESGRDVIIY